MHLPVLIILESNLANEPEKIMNNTHGLHMKLKF